MMWPRRLQSPSSFLAILASSRANAAQISAPGIDSSVAFCGPSCLKQTSRLANSNCAGAALLHRTAFAAAGVSKTRYLTSRNMNSFFGDGESVPRINREAMAEIIEDVANSSREECGYVIIDVRGHDEVAYTGKLDDVVHTLPLPYIAEGALTMDEEDFSEQFGFEKPRLDETIVFTCKAGIRSASAAKLAQMAGYSDILDYAGGSNEWFS
ncbi:hypothetical protein HJC23_002561 [Cyclotella cryptica]|uniref:Rhodanese domain-containing protein n=1 Tax=Cyclotella cryptica TaxID=29204 RepID=A0ABD3QW37_9STRA|eukprot:CCRYP_001418-RA/>CCRYP_001418-RA protein AED:0.39 eAED:0.39 QI:0/-1/0/1/-1/1/1/0/210